MSATPQIESELKLGIEPASELRTLLATLPSPFSITTQHNCYFTDPEGQLANARVMLRVRAEMLSKPEPSRVLVTIKRGTSQGDGVFVSEETEAFVDTAHWQDLRSGSLDPITLDTPPIAQLREEFGLQRTCLIGCLINRRHRVRYQGFVLELDETKLPDGRVEAEVEVETLEVAKARELLVTLSATANVQLRQQDKSKYLRFLEALGQLKNSAT